MTAYDEGPWEIRKVNNGDHLRFVPMKDGKDLLKLGGTNGSDKAHGNAALVEAAPDLLKAAEYVADFFGVEGRMASAKLYERLLPLLAAIKKANGQTEADPEEDDSDLEDAAWESDHGSYNGAVPSDFVGEANQPKSDPLFEGYPGTGLGYV